MKHRKCIFVNNFEQLEKAFRLYFKIEVPKVWYKTNHDFSNYKEIACKEVVNEGIILYYHHDRNYNIANVAWDRQAVVGEEIKKYHANEIIYINKLMPTE